MKNSKKIFFLVMGSILVLTPFFYLSQAKAGDGVVAVAPQVTIISPVLDSSSQANTLIVSYKTDQSASIYFFRDNVQIAGTGTGAGVYSYSFTNLAIGPHVLKIKACNSNNTILCTEASVNYVVLGAIVSAPQVTITSPLKDETSTYNSRTIAYTLDKSATITFLDNDIKVNTTGKNAGNDIYTFSNLTVGSHTLKILACVSDGSNLCSTASVMYTVVADISTINAPQIIITSPKQAEVSSGNYNLLTVTYYLDKSATIYFLDNNSNVYVTGKNEGTDIYTFKNLSIGSHILEIKACDSGNVSLCSKASFNYTVLSANATAPVINITSPENNQSGIETNLELGFSLSQNTMLHFFDNGIEKPDSGGTYQGSMYPTGTYNYTFSNLSVGKHVFKLKACHPDNNTVCSEASLNYTVVTTNTDTSPAGVISLSNPSAVVGTDGRTVTFKTVLTNNSTNDLAKDKALQFKIQLAEPVADYVLCSTALKNILAKNDHTDLTCTKIFSDADINDIKLKDTLDGDTLDHIKIDGINKKINITYFAYFDYNLSSSYKSFELNLPTTTSGNNPGNSDDKDDSTTVTYSWNLANSWSSCNSGLKTKTYECWNNSGIKVADNLCGTSKPADKTETCGTENQTPNLVAVNFKFYNADTLVELTADPKINESFLILPNIKISQEKLNDKFWYKVYLDDKLVNIGLHVNTLDINNSYQTLGSSSRWLFDKVENHKFKLVVDSENQIIESNEADNIFEQIINFSPESFDNNATTDTTKQTVTVTDYILDTDDDGLSNYQESLYATAIDKVDTDDDGYEDLTEIRGGYNPLVNETKKASNKLSRSLYSKLVPVSAENKTKAISNLKSELKKLNNNVALTISSSNLENYVNAFIYGGYSPEEIYQSLKKGLGTVHPSIEASVWRNREQ